MTTKIKCFTLFDITRTNITSRRLPSDSDIDTTLVWQTKRNTQCNFDTVIQLISLRAQPEDITDPAKLSSNTDPFENFGTNCKAPFDYWTFTFTINHDGAFDAGENKFGLLHSDCVQVPIVKITESSPNYLDVTSESRNIYFEVTDNE